MGKLLKPLVVIVLLASLAAVCIQGFVLFPKRTLIKDRTQKLEGGVERLVSTLKGSLSEEIQQAVPFVPANLKVGHPDQLPRLEGELAKASAVADAVLQGWNDTKTDLENTRRDLEQTRAELEQTRTELEAANTQIVQLNETIRNKDAELVEKSNLIAGLEDEKATLSAQIEELNSQIATMQDEIAQLQEDKGVLEAQLEKYEKELSKEITMKPGTAGKIVYANEVWNFVVIDIGANAGVQAGAEMIMQRNDNMMGKIKISAVRDSIAIAEVMPSFQTADVKEGDDVLF
jgi:septal ring factor EnvC (AmiA/AmiB activator)